MHAVRQVLHRARQETLLLKFDLALNSYAHVGSLQERCGSQSWSACNWHSTWASA